MDPLFSLVGQTIATSLTLMPLNPKEFYVVVEIGRDGQAGPAGHY